MINKLGITSFLKTERSSHWDDLSLTGFTHKCTGSSRGLRAKPPVPNGIPSGIGTVRGKGSILVWAMVAMVMLSGLIFAGVDILQNTTKLIESNIEYYGQTTSIAKAGLLDALGWFRRQTGQPVIAFNPQRDLIVFPPINDTDDPAIGIVRDLEVDPSLNLYGRYEVITSSVIDVSEQRGLVADSGTIWYIESIGYLYLRLDEFKAYNVWPNRVVASARLATEIRRISMNLPSLCALFAKRPNGTTSTIGNNTRINGGTRYGINYPDTPPPIGTLITTGAEITGTSGATVPISPVNDTCVQVFGVTESELQSLADYSVITTTDLPNPIPDYKIVFFNGNATFDATHRLRGTGIFYITGNLTINSGSQASSYNGIIYCKGVYTQNAPSMISGSIIAQGRVDILSVADISEVNYDSRVLQQVQNYTGTYRLNKGFYQID